MENWKKYIFGSITGNVIELYDFILFAYFSVILGSLFSPSTDPFAQTLFSFCVFATGCFMRPLGALLFGYWGDRFGRRWALIYSLSLISITTTCMGLLPTYDQAGLLAPILLICCRLLQGLSMSGEQVGASIFLTENAPHHQYGFASSFVMGSVYLGLLLGSIVTILVTVTLTHEQLVSWGWRIPFLLSSVLGAVALLIRLRQLDSIEFRQIQKNNQVLKNPLLTVLQKYSSSLILATMLSSMLAVAVYLFAVYMPNYFKTVAGFSFIESMYICSVSFLFTGLVVIATGYFLDYIGAKKVMLTGCYGFLIFSYPIFMLLGTNQLWCIFMAQSMLVILLGIVAGALMPILISLFPVQVRYCGVGIAFNVGMTIFGSTAPVVALSLAKYLESQSAPALYLMFAALLSIATLSRKTTTQYLPLASDNELIGAH